MCEVEDFGVKKELRTNSTFFPFFSVLVHNL